jgi:UDP-N-acetylglucosamine:LPS N-acetylglucosamine transferase
VLSYKLDQLLADPHRLSSMQTNARKMGRPNAAKEIVDRITELTA